MIRKQIDKTAANFEIFSFAVIKVHLEKFACKIYRDTRTAAHDKGVDLSTNFGVVYQVKKLRIHTESEADRLYADDLPPIFSPGIMRLSPVLDFPRLRL